MSGGVDVDCVAQLIPSNEEWKCYFAEFVLPHITSPIFAINSLHDTGSPLLILQLGDCLSPNGCDSGADFSEVLANLREVCNVYTTFCLLFYVFNALFFNYRNLS